MQNEARNLMAALVLAQVDNTREDLGSRRRSAVGSATRRRFTQRNEPVELRNILEHEYKV